MISQGHWVNQQTTCPMVWRTIYTCSSFKYVQHIIPVPVVIYYWISSAHILIPHYTIWSFRWILIVIITARDNKTGTQQSFDFTRHCYLPSTGAAPNISCKRVVRKMKINYNFKIIYNNFKINYNFKCKLFPIYKIKSKYLQTDR